MTRLWAKIVKAKHCLFPNKNEEEKEKFQVFTLKYNLNHLILWYIL